MSHSGRQAFELESGLGLQVPDQCRTGCAEFEFAATVFVDDPAAFIFSVISRLLACDYPRELDLCGSNASVLTPVCPLLIVGISIVP